MDMQSLFLGKPFDYWIGLQESLDMAGVPPTFEKVLLENVRLRARVSFYEQQTREAAAFNKSVGELR